jgi:WD40 repeat protein
MREMVSRTYFVVRIALITLVVILLNPNESVQTLHAQNNQDVIEMAFNSDGRYVATVSRQGLVTVFDTESEQISMIVEGEFGASIAWHPIQSDELAISGRTQGVQIFNVSDGVVIANFNTEPITYSVVFSPDGQYIITSHGTPGDGPLATGFISAIEISTGNSPISFDSVPQRITEIAWQPNGNIIAGLNIGDVGEIVLWDFRTGDILSRLSQAQIVEDDLGSYVVGSISDLIWVLDGQQLVATSELQFTSYTSDTFEDGVQSEYLFVIEDIAVSPQGNLIAVASGYDRQIKLVSVTTGEITETIETTFDVNAVSWNPDGSLFYGGESQESFKVAELNFSQASSLRLTSLCSPDPDNIRIWRVRNTKAIPAKCQSRV